VGRAWYPSGMSGGERAPDEDEKQPSDESGDSEEKVNDPLTLRDSKAPRKEWKG
jgi:hypothetical protein